MAFDETAVIARDLCSGSLGCPNSGWRPIDTAPKDGLQFVGKVLVGRLWQSEQTEEWHLSWAQVATLMSSGWHATTEGWATGGMACVGPLNPTHWMPLPGGLQ